MELQENVTEIITNSDRTSHLVIFGENSDYILSVSRADGKDLTEEDVKKALSVKQGSDSYGLRFYEKPEHDASDDERERRSKRQTSMFPETRRISQFPGQIP